MKGKLFIKIILLFTIFQSCISPSFNQNIKANTSEIDLLKEVDSEVLPINRTVI